MASTRDYRREGVLFHGWRTLDSLRLMGGAVLVALIAGVASVRIEAGLPTAPDHVFLVGGTALALALGLSLARYELVAMLAFVLIGFVRFEPGPPDVLFGALITVAVVTGRLRADRLSAVVAALLGTFLVLNLVSFVDAVDVLAAVRYFLITTYLIVLAVWLTGYATSFRRLAPLIRAYVLGAVLMSAAASTAVFVPFPGSSLLLYGDQRAMGLFKDPNVFGPFLVLALLVLAEETARPRIIGVGRLAKGAGMAILALGVLLSFSRAAWLNGATALLVLLAVYALRRRWAARVVVFGIALVAISAFLVAAVVVSGSGGFLQERAQLHTYDAERFEAQRIGFSLAMAHPLGIGPGQYEFFAPIAAHSLYVRVFAEQGVLGLAAILLLVTLTFVLALLNVFRGVDTFGVGSAVLLAAWCGMVVNSLFIDTLHWRHFWVVAALVWAGAHLRTRSNGTIPR